MCQFSLLPCKAFLVAFLGIPADVSLARTMSLDYFWLQGKSENVIIIIF